MPTKTFDAIFKALRAIMQRYEKNLNKKQDDPGHYHLDGHYSEKFGRDLFFGGVRIGKRYVSYHLMPVYMYPDLLTGMSPALSKRMQGKSCFNFTKVDEDVFEELARLTTTGYERFAEQE